MPKTRISTRASKKARVGRDSIVEESSSPRRRVAKDRFALDDVSNKKAGNGAVLGSDNCAMIDFNEKKSIPRSRRTLNIDLNAKDRNIIRDHKTKPPLTQVPARSFVSKRGQVSNIQATKNDDTLISSATKEGVENTKLYSDAVEKSAVRETSTNIISQRFKHRNNKNSFGIESQLLEPRPKRKRRKLTKVISKKRSEESTMICGRKHDMKERVPQAMFSELPTSTSALVSTNFRSSDLPVSSDDDHRLVRKFEGPFDPSIFTTGIATYDKSNEGNVGEVSAYVTDIFQRLFDAEKITRPSPSYLLNQQHEINCTMRAVLVDWLASVGVKFRLQPETLYLCVNIIDRYLSRRHVRRQRLQLLGIAALFVACKYEEIYPLEAKDCVYVTDRAYNRQEVLDMEFDIVMVLGFKMTVPTAHPFLQRFLHVTNAPVTIRNLACFYTERMLQEYCMLNFRASLLASAAVCLAWNHPTAIEYCDETEIVHKLPRVLDTITNYTGFCEEEIRHTAKVLCAKMQPLTQLNKVYLKYRSEVYSEVSRYEPPRISHLDS